MKRYLALILVLSFFIQSFSSLWIFTSFHLNKKYISENICINRFDKIPTCEGQCFLTKELQKNEQKDDVKFPSSKHNEIQLFQPSEYSFKLNNELYIYDKSTSIFSPELATKTFCNTIFHPPKTFV